MPSIEQTTNGSIDCLEIKGEGCHETGRDDRVLKPSCFLVIRDELDRKRFNEMRTLQAMGA